MRPIPKNADLVERLNHFIGQSTPFGPIDAAPITDEDIDLGVLSFLFNEQNESWAQYARRPSIVVGRRGSGKTAYIKRLKADPSFAAVAELTQPAAFQSVLKAMEGFAQRGHLFVEQTADIWNLLFWNAIVAAIYEKFSATHSFPRTAEYLLHINAPPGASSERIIQQTLNQLSQHPQSILEQVVSKAGPVALNSFVADTHFNEARQEVERFLQREKKTVLLILDSMDDYKLDNKDVANAIDGLLKTLGIFNEINKRAQIRFCLPAEVYHSVFSISSNPIKDFQNEMTLRWRGQELIAIAADRLSTYAQLNDGHWRQRFGAFDLDKRHEALRLLSEIFPAEAANALKVNETWLAYVMRHTQMLPRHFLQYLNAIFRTNLKMRGDPLSIRPEAVARGIKSEEEKVCQEIFQAFRYRYPYAREVCRAIIPELPRVFTDADLKRVFRIHARRLMKQGKMPSFSDYERLREILVEIGVFGRVTDRHGHYVRAVFEYTVPHKLRMSVDDELAMHPVFSGPFSARHPPNAGTSVVYPLGADLDDDLESLK